MIRDHSFVSGDQVAAGGCNVEALNAGSRVTQI